MSSLPRALVLLNPAAHGGRGQALWRRVEPVVARRLEARVVKIDASDTWRAAVATAVNDGVRVFVAAGGDGTVNVLLNTLGAARGERPLRQFTLGAVGLGSSNDFHKPSAWVVRDVPLKLGLAAPRLRDVGEARFVTPEGREASRLFIVSASVGLVAEANALFTAGGGLLRVLKPCSTSAAIGWAALRALAAHRDRPAVIGIDDDVRPCALTSLNVMKTVHLSGRLRFDTPVSPDDGRFAVNLCAGLGRAGALRALRDLSCGRFLGPATHALPRGRAHWRAARCSVVLARPAALELDGEIVRATRVTFSICPEQIRECT